MIITDDMGRPFVRPERQDFDSDSAFMRAFWAYKDLIADTANQAFAIAFRDAIRKM